MSVDDIQKDVIDTVTPEMIAAGLDRLQDLAGENDVAYLVEAIYLAMEYQRLDSLGQLRRPVRQGMQIG